MSSSEIYQKDELLARESIVLGLSYSVGSLTDAQFAWISHQTGRELEVS